MATYIIQRMYTATNTNVPQSGQEEQKKKSSLGKKLAIAGGIAATAGLATYGIQQGKIGTAGMQKSVNKALANVGGYVGNIGKPGGKLNNLATKVGDKMVSSGAQGAGRATARTMAEVSMKKGLNFTAEQIEAGASKAADRVSNYAMLGRLNAK